MAKDLSYERSKSATTNTTPINHTFQGRESPDAFASLSTGTGTAGAADLKVLADADESAGADVQDLWDVKVTPQLSGDGTISLLVEATPVLGDGTPGTKVSQAFSHEETMDQWQAAAGRPRQA